MSLRSRYIPIGISGIDLNTGKAHLVSPIAWPYGLADRGAHALGLPSMYDKLGISHPLWGISGAYGVGVDPPGLGTGGVISPTFQLLT